MMSGDSVDARTVAQQIMSNPTLMAALQAKIAGMAGQSSGYIESFPAEVQRRIKALKNLNLKHAELEREFHREVAALEKKYLRLYSPLYQKRTEITTGEYEPNDEECEYHSEDDESEEEEEDVEGEEEEEIEKEVGDLSLEDKEEKAAEPVKGIPCFWLTAMQNCAETGGLIMEYDVPILEKLRDVRLSYLEEGEEGYRLEFEFEDNEFFTNKVLTKTYFFDNDGGSSDLIFDRAEGTKIEWASQEKNVTVEKVVKRQKNKASGKVRVKTTYDGRPSFFNFFSPPEDEDEEEIDDEVTDALELDFAAGEAFKNRLIPHAVLWFTGEADEDYDEDDEEEDEDEDFEDMDDEDEDDDENDPDFDPKNAETPQECKQQ